jgi:hypothetical protein
VIALVAVLTAGSAGAWIVQRNRMAAELFVSLLLLAGLVYMVLALSRQAGCMRSAPKCVA